MTDTWSTLEQRFRELAAKAPELFLNFLPPDAEWKSVPTRHEWGDSSRQVMTGWEKSERGWTTPSGQWKWYSSGNRGDLHSDELVQLINRADRLLAVADPESNSSRFVGIALERYGDTALSFVRESDVVFRDRPPISVHNAAEFCALTAGYIGTCPDKFVVMIDPPEETGDAQLLTRATTSGCAQLPKKDLPTDTVLSELINDIKNTPASDRDITKMCRKATRDEAEAKRLRSRVYKYKDLWQ